MSENKPTPAPWHFEELSGGHNFSIVDSESGIHLANVGDDEVLSKMEGYLPGTKILANTKAIVASYNGTYGIGVNPEAVKEMLETLKATLVLADKDLKNKYLARSAECQAMYDRVVAAIEKAKIHTI